MPGLNRTEALAALFRRAGVRRVYGIDARGRGGVLSDEGTQKTGGWERWVETLVLACVEGDSEWTRLPHGPAR